MASRPQNALQKENCLRSELNDDLKGILKLSPVRAEQMVTPIRERVQNVYENRQDPYGVAGEVSSDGSVWRARHGTPMKLETFVAVLLKLRGRSLAECWRDYVEELQEHFEPAPSDLARVRRGAGDRDSTVELPLLEPSGTRAGSENAADWQGVRSKDSRKHHRARRMSRCALLTGGGALLILLLVGLALFVFGPVSGALAQNVLYKFDGGSAGDWFGLSVAGADDVNNDGFPDLVVGAYLDDNNGPDSGSAQVFSGRDGSVLYTFNGVLAGDLLGWEVDAAGDVNKDGYADIIASSFGADPNGPGSGSAQVFSGRDGSVLYTFNGDAPGDFFGIEVAGAGDVNRDGYPDLIVGAYQSTHSGSKTGSARVFSGADGSVLYTFLGDGAGDEFGLAVAGAGDVNKDGYADLIVGAEHNDNVLADAGFARVFSGRDGSVLYTFNGDAANDRLGRSVAGAGDVNRDGYADVIVGAWQPTTGPGYARVFSGIDGSILHTFTGDTVGDNFGWDAGCAGDVNKDGYSDLVVGAFLDDNNGVDSGSVRVFSGRDGSVLYTANGDAGDRFGGSVEGAGDVNQDGLPEIIVGSFFDSPNGPESGSATVLFSEVASPAVLIRQLIARVESLQINRGIRFALVKTLESAERLLTRSAHLASMRIDMFSLLVKVFRRFGFIPAAVADELAAAAEHLISILENL